MPITSDKRVSVSNDSAPKSPALYLWNVEAAGHPSSARCSCTVSSQAAAMLKKVRSAGPESFRRTDGSGRTPGAGDSTYGHHSIYMDVASAPIARLLRPLGQVVRRALVQQVDQRLRPRGNRRGAAAHNVSRRQLLPVDRFVRIRVLTQGRTFERYPGKEAARSRVGQNFSAHGDVGRRAGGSPLRA